MKATIVIEVEYTQASEDKECPFVVITKIDSIGHYQNDEPLIDVTNDDHIEVMDEYRHNGNIDQLNDDIVHFLEQIMEC